jgi:hypothetical protein
MVQDIRNDRLTGGDVLQRHRCPVELSLAEQQHDVHSKKRSGVGVLPKGVLNHVQGALDVALVQQRIGGVHRRPLGTLRAPGEQQNNHPWNQAQHNE